MSSRFGFGGFGLGFFSADYLLTFDELTKYYMALLIVQYRVKPKAFNTIGVLVAEPVAGSIAQQVRDAFDLDTAVGQQLDILAGYRGAQRTVFGIDLSRDYFHMPLYDDPTPEDGFGFAEYGDAVISAYWILYADAHRPVDSLTDDELRRMVKFLAKSQSRYLGLKEIDDILFEFFGTNVTLTDNGDMTITYAHDVGDPDTLFTILSETGNLPAPAGVQVLLT